MEKTISQAEMMQLLDKLYEQAVNGIGKVSPPLVELAQNYLEKNKDIETAAKKFIQYQVIKCTTSGFLSGLGGVITLPVTVPANVGSVLYVQMRMIACLAYMGGYDPKCDHVGLCLPGGYFSRSGGKKYRN